jgi:hypothetical protein
MLHQRITIRVSPIEFRRLQQEARARGVNLSTYVRRSVGEYLDLKTELAETMSSDGPAGNGDVNDLPTPRIIHTLLARTEERIAATIDGQAERISRLREDVRAMAAMVDRAYFGYLAHTPEIDPELRTAALSAARRRHTAWLGAIEQFLRAGGGDLRLMLDAEGEAS